MISIFITGVLGSFLVVGLVLFCSNRKLAFDVTKFFLISYSGYALIGTILLNCL